MASIDDLAPSYIREKRIDLTLDPSNPVVRAGRPVLIGVSYARALPAGIMLPLVLEIQGPSPGGYQRREFTRTVPAGVIFTPREGGPHLVTLREAAHNRWWGSLTLDIEGELIDPPSPV